jgi:hypothetical protein
MIHSRFLIILLGFATYLQNGSADAQEPRVRSPWLLPSSNDFPLKPDLAGCYLLVRRVSGRDSPWPATLPFAYAPARMQIRPTKTPPNSVHYEAATGPGGIQGPSLSRPPVQRPHPDSIVINFHGGLHGVSLRFRYNRNGWTGRIHEVSDVNSDRQLLGHVVARPVECMVWLRDFRDFRRIPGS